METAVGVLERATPVVSGAARILETVWERVVETLVVGDGVGANVVKEDEVGLE